jgi:hypothetical protein
LKDPNNLKPGTYLIRILKPLAYMDLDKYIQFANYNSIQKRFFVHKGAAGWKSIGLKSVEILASPITIYEEPKFKFPILILQKNFYF